MPARSRTRSSPAASASPLEQALDRAKAEDRVLVLGLHGGRAENGELQAMCEAARLAFTGSGSASSHLAFDKVAAKRFAALGGVTSPAGIALDDIDAAFAEYGRLIAKPARDGSSYGLIFVNAKQDLVAVRNAAKTEEYRDRAVHRRHRGDLRRAGAVGRLDRSRCRRSRSFRPRAVSTTPRNISLKSTQEICPGPLFAGDQRCDQGPGAAGASGAVLHAAIRAPTSSSRTRGRSISRPTRCRA